MYDNYDGVVALPAAVTERVKLATAILLSPLHGNAALLAKQVASLDRLSGGRRVLALAVGARSEDFTAAGLPMRGRGALLEAQITEARATWTVNGVGSRGHRPVSASPGGPPIMLGGHSPKAINRAAGGRVDLRQWPDRYPSDNYGSRRWCCGLCGRRGPAGETLGKLAEVCCWNLARRPRPAEELQDVVGDGVSG